MYCYLASIIIFTQIISSNQTSMENMLHWFTVIIWKEHAQNICMTSIIIDAFLDALIVSINFSRIWQMDAYLPLYKTPLPVVTKQTLSAWPTGQTSWCYTLTVQPHQSATSPQPDYLPVDRFACADSPIEDIPDVNSLQARHPSPSSSPPGMPMSLPQAFWPCRSTMPPSVFLEIGKRTPSPPAVLRVQGVD